MVEFITLFLGALITGPNLVKVQAHQDVAMLEVRLDDHSVATLHRAPWELEVDFGEALVPHLLEAVAYAGSGGEIGRARQWVNLSPKATEVTVVLDRDRSTGEVKARVSWESLSKDNAPIRASARFDGEALDVHDPRVIPLPPHDPGRLHQLRVELEFPGALESAAEVTFGGPYGDTVTTALTALPVALGPRRELPAVEEMQGWFRSGDRPLRVQTAEKGLAEIVVVRSPEAGPHIRQTTLRGSRPVRPIPAKDHRFRFVGVRPLVMVRAQGPFIVFPRSEEIGLRVAGLREVLRSVDLPVNLRAEPRLADAVAVAGSFANQSGRRRAVVLITTGRSRGDGSAGRDATGPDASQFAPQEVRRYLESIGVPLVVWNPERGEKDAGAWGASLNISTDSLLETAYRKLTRTLDRQRIVWLDGLHLPQTLTVDPSVEGVQVVR